MNSFGARSTLRVGKREYEIYRLDALDKTGHMHAHTCLSRCAFCWRTCCAAKTDAT